MVVCSPKIIIKSLLKIKLLSKKITKTLRKQKLLSHVSLSVTTKNRIKKTLPTIFYQDLTNNGKLVYGENLKEVFPKYETKEVSSIDIFRLIFNRMTELLEALVNSGIFEKKMERIDFNLIGDYAAKFIFSLIQSILIKNEEILIFNGINLKDLKFNSMRGKNYEFLKDLIGFYETYSEESRKKEISSITMIENLFVDINQQTRLTLNILSNTKDTSPIFFRQFFKENGKFGERIKLSLFVFLQYIKIYKISILLRAIIQNIKFGTDHVYPHLFKLFIEVPTVIHHRNELIENIGSSDGDRQNNSLLKKEILISDWLETFHKYYELWRIKTGI